MPKSTGYMQDIRGGKLRAMGVFSNPALEGCAEFTGVCFDGFLRGPVKRVLKGILRDLCGCLAGLK